MTNSTMAINVNRILDSFPNILWPLRTYIIKKILRSVGKRVCISRTAYFENVFTVNIGNDVFINRDFYCSTVKMIFIKDRVMIGPNCTIIGGDHDYSRINSCMRFCKFLGDNKEIVIEEDAWIGCGTLILKKAKIGEGTIVGANSLVNNPLLPYSVYAGQPARFIKPRFEKLEDLSLHLDYMRNMHGFETSYSFELLESLYSDQQ